MKRRRKHARSRSKMPLHVSSFQTSQPSLVLKKNLTAVTLQKTATKVLRSWIRKKHPYSRLRLGAELHAARIYCGLRISNPPSRNRPVLLISNSQKKAIFTKYRRLLRQKKSSSLRSYPSLLVAKHAWSFQRVSTREDLSRHVSSRESLLKPINVYCYLTFTKLAHTFVQQTLSLDKSLLLNHHFETLWGIQQGTHLSYDVAFSTLISHVNRRSRSDHKRVDLEKPTAHKSTALSRRLNKLMHSSCSDLQPTTSAINALASWTLEKSFYTKLSSPRRGSMFVLSVVPGYRMVPSMSVSSDRHRENFFRDVGFTQAVNYNPTSLSTWAKVDVANLKRFLYLTSKPTLRSYTLRLNIKLSKYVQSKKTLRDTQTSQLLITTALLQTKLALGDLTKRTLVRLLQLKREKRSIPDLRSKRRPTRRRVKRNRRPKLVLRSPTFQQHTSSLRVINKFIKKDAAKFTRNKRYFLRQARKDSFHFTKLLRLPRKKRAELKYFTNRDTYTNARLSKMKSSQRSHKAPKLVNKNTFLQHVASPSSNVHTIGPFTNTNAITLLMTNPLLLKTYWLSTNPVTQPRFLEKLARNNQDSSLVNCPTNIIPHSSFNKVFVKQAVSSLANRSYRDDVTPLYYHTIVRFIEECTGRRALFQFYPFVNQHVDKDFMVRYRKWLPRLTFYEKRLGHRFFLEEALHIMHLGFVLRDPKLIAHWMRAIILRISFWKTRSIFRFLKYLFHNYYIHVFDDLRIKGMKIKLKGKISVAGNGRKRSILYRIGETSHSRVDLRVVKESLTINTFTGVLGFQVYLFY